MIHPTHYTPTNITPICHCSAHARGKKIKYYAIGPSAKGGKGPRGKETRLIDEISRARCSKKGNSEPVVICNAPYADGFCNLGGLEFYCSSR